MSGDGAGPGSGEGTGNGKREVRVRPARGDEADAVRRLLDAAMLSVPDDLPERVAAGDVLVAVDGSGEREDDAAAGGGDVIGTLVLDGRRIEAVAVRKSRRAAGVGRALVAAADARSDGPLTATFRPGVRPFYESLGFDIAAEDPGDQESTRLRGELPDGAVREGE
ncbi:GNAT family N-acetyltransferase [Halobaculum sp. EA56]|uniref:GNAT family N-acetyltransferase n=1 Tax=Halobaculum sp. EA56 TaxID=3421648 RepID=UPI003EBCC15F